MGRQEVLLCGEAERLLLAPRKAVSLISRLLFLIPHHDVGDDHRDILIDLFQRQEGQQRMVIVGAELLLQGVESEFLELATREDEEISEGTCSLRISKAFS